MHVTEVRRHPPNKLDAVSSRFATLGFLVVSSSKPRSPLTITRWGCVSLPNLKIPRLVFRYCANSRKTMLSYLPSLSAGCRGLDHLRIHFNTSPQIFQSMCYIGFKNPKPPPNPLRPCVTHLPLMLEDGVMRLVEDRSINTFTPLMRPFLEVGRRIYQYSG